MFHLEIDLAFWTLNLINIAISLLLLIVFQLVFSYIKKYKFYSKIQSNTKLKIIYNIIIGVVIGLGSGMIFGLGSYFLYSFIPFTAIGLVWISAVFISPYICVGAFIPFIVGATFFLLEGPIFIWLLLIMYILLALVVFASEYMKTNKMIFQLTYQVVYFIIIALLIWTMIPKESQLNLFISLIIFLVFDFVGYFVSHYLNVVITKTKKLSESAEYDNKYYINANYAIDSINEYVKNNNTQFALIIVFKIYGLEKKAMTVGKQAANTINSTVSSKIYEVLKNDNALFFKTLNNDFACLVNLDKKEFDLSLIYEGNDSDKNSTLQYFQNQIHLIPKRVKYNRESININLFGFASIYGIHSNNFKTLLNYCSQTSNVFELTKSASVLQVYNPHKVSAIDTDVLDYLNLRKEVDLKSTRVSIEEIDCKWFEEPSKKITVLSPKLIRLSKITANKEKIINSIPKILQDDFIRNISARALKLFSEVSNQDNYMLVIDYPVNKLINENFIAQALYRKIISYTGSVNSIILNFDICNEHINVPFFNKNLIKLVDLGFSISLDNVDEKSLSMIELIKPQFVTIHNIETKDGKDQRLVSKYYELFIKVMKSKKVNVLYE